MVLRHNVMGNVTQPAAQHAGRTQEAQPAGVSVGISVFRVSLDLTVTSLAGPLSASSASARQVGKGMQCQSKHIIALRRSPSIQAILAEANTTMVSEVGFVIMKLACHMTN